MSARDRILYAGQAKQGDQYIADDHTLYRIQQVYAPRESPYVVLSVHVASRPGLSHDLKVPRSQALGLRHNTI